MVSWTGTWGVIYCHALLSSANWLPAASSSICWRNWWFGFFFLCLWASFLWLVCRSLLVNCHILEANIWSVWKEHLLLNMVFSFTLKAQQSNAAGGSVATSSCWLSSSSCPSPYVNLPAFPPILICLSGKDSVNSSHLLQHEVSRLIFDQLWISSVICQLLTGLWKVSSQVMVSDHSLSRWWFFWCFYAIWSTVL